MIVYCSRLELYEENKLYIRFWRYSVIADVVK